MHHHLPPLLLPHLLLLFLSTSAQPPRERVDNECPITHIERGMDINAERLSSIPVRDEGSCARICCSLAKIQSCQVATFVLTPFAQCHIYNCTTNPAACFEPIRTAYRSVTQWVVPFPTTTTSITTEGTTQLPTSTVTKEVCGEVIVTQGRDLIRTATASANGRGKREAKPFNTLKIGSGASCYSKCCGNIDCTDVVYDSSTDRCVMYKCDEIAQCVTSENKNAVIYTIPLRKTETTTISTTKTTTSEIQTTTTKTTTSEIPATTTKTTTSEIPATTTTLTTKSPSQTPKIFTENLPLLSDTTEVVPNLLDMAKEIPARAVNKFALTDNIDQLFAETKNPLLLNIVDVTKPMIESFIKGLPTEKIETTSSFAPFTTITTTTESTTTSTISFTRRTLRPTPTKTTTTTTRTTTTTTATTTTTTTSSSTTTTTSSTSTPTTTTTPLTTTTFSTSPSTATLLNPTNTNLTTNYSLINSTNTSTNLTEYYIRLTNANGMTPAAAFVIISVLAGVAGIGVLSLTALAVRRHLHSREIDLLLQGGDKFLYRRPETVDNYREYAARYWSMNRHIPQAMHIPRVRL